jgi:murein DD-endopeptidase MepM/ murein hydrolase activator NlpD
MVADSSSRGSRLFPEIRIDLRTTSRSSQILVRPAVQITTASAVVIVAVALFYLGVSRIGYVRVLADKETAVVRAETANADLQDELAALRNKLALAARDREQTEERLRALASQTDSLRGLLSSAESRLRSVDERSRLSQQRGEVQRPPAATEETAAMASKLSELTQALEQARRELRRVEAQRATLAARLSKIRTDRGEQGRDGQYKGSLGAATKKLQQVSGERDKAVDERDRLRARIEELEQKHSERRIPSMGGSANGFRLAGFIIPDLAQPETDGKRPELMLITDAPPTSERDPGGVAELAGRAVGEFARVLASTGLNVKRLFPQLGLARAEGGPFVPPPKADQAGAISSDRLEAMRSLIKSLPLSTPLDQYQIESRFGPRRDPFNRRLSFHTGIDLSASYMAPVYATASGTVTYAGYRADYGKVVEISHGNGIATVYGHLHRHTVSVGQTVAEHSQIGFVGSTGRSSGPHVHYEVLVNDEPQDPEKFLGLARVIPVSDR